MGRQEGGVIGESRDAARLDPGARRRQRHLPEAMVMSVRLPICRDVDELGARALVEPGQQSRRHRVP
jgi:hypothetical protein